jgi:hypothetical protein
MTFRAYVDNGNGQMVTQHGHQYVPVLEGAQVPLTAT